MIPTFYQNLLKKQLNRSHYLMLALLVHVLQLHKNVSLEKLATWWSYPIQFESRRRSIQRFLVLPNLLIETIWFPLITFLLSGKYQPGQTAYLALDRTQFRDKNLLFISLIWQRRAIPLYWQILAKKGSSNLREQQMVIEPIRVLLKNYKIIILGDREFGSVKLGKWLRDEGLQFVLRIKAERYIQTENDEYQRLSKQGLLPGTSFFLADVIVTKQSGFGQFNIAAYWRRKYGKKVEKEGWYLLTNMSDLKASIQAFKKRSGIEAMFKDCKTGGYNLEASHASDQRLKNLVLLISIAYISAILLGEKTSNKGVQKYIGRVKEIGRIEKRHSNFWIGLYGRDWVFDSELCEELIEELMRLRQNKRCFFAQGLRAKNLILYSL